MDAFARQDKTDLENYILPVALELQTICSLLRFALKRVSTKLREYWPSREDKRNIIKAAR